MPTADTPHDAARAIVIGSDHAALGLKETVKTFLSADGYNVVDMGTHEAVSVNYADYAKKVAEAVSSGVYSRGILLCGTGLGMSMAANRYPHVRAALCNDVFSAGMSRKHNDANILVMGGRVIGDVLALEVVKTWLNTPFEGGRHKIRIDSFDEITRLC
ncbi:MAG: ribose 5-phosphate isomerase B [Deltaproteobacteria bacterium]|nr:MAG: ribose 5-phosphate isomerase B [Deltaproteobacteria bacterium]